MPNIEEKLDLILTVVNNHDKRIDSLKEDLNGKIESLGRDVRRIEYRLDKIENRLDKYTDKLEEVYESRNKVAVKFTQSRLFASFFVAMLASLTAVAISKGVV